MEINEIESRKTIEKKINKMKSLFFEKINKMDKPLVRLMRKIKERRHIINNRNERDSADIKRIIR